jgi:hypothetical protein
VMPFCRTVTMLLATHRLTLSLAPETSHPENLMHASAEPLRRQSFSNGA